ncbi:MAG: AAA family ATPase [Thioalkalispiraceae bacterium]|jgi:lon-related putative ATP-dependent protease
MSKPEALPAEKLYTHCDPEQFTFRTTAELDEIKEFVGQERAKDALQFGIGIQREGYNLYVLGPSGYGKHSMVRHYLEQQRDTSKKASDWCYVGNFLDPQKPIVIEFVAGQGISFKQDMQQLVSELSTAIPSAFETEQYQVRTQEIQDQFQERTRQAFMELARDAEQHHIAVIRTPTDIRFVPEKNGKTLSNEEYEALSDEEKERIEQIIDVLDEKVQSIFRQRQYWQREAQEQLHTLNKEVGLFASGHLIDELKQKYKDVEGVEHYLNTVQEDVIEHLHEFRQHSEQDLFAEELVGQKEKSTFRRYQVNLIVDNAEKKGVPIVYENNPTFQNLVGRVEYISQMGTLVTDYMMIKPGALHKANGGYLILDAIKVLIQPHAWEGLKRAISSRCINIQSVAEMFGLISTASLEPQPIPLNIKIILIGDRRLYYLLMEFDPEFAELFKVAADFDDSIPRDDSNNIVYAKLLATLVKKEKLLDFDREAIARAIEHSSRLADDAEKLSTRMLSVADLMREADYWARQRQAGNVSREDVQKAIDKQVYRLNRYHTRIQEEIERGTILIDVEGEKTGQVNGLFVIELGDHAFAQPARITATARLGEGEVIDIEREVDLGGAIHSKGVMILSSFLSSRYAHDYPLSISASLVFEQSYGMVEGDSATVGELCALLSVLAKVPVKQSLAVTGSANQHGQVQAIGGVNEKIEGFFDVCKTKGLTGEQGVIIPRANVAHLMLRDDVVTAVREGNFSIYPVSNIDEAIELLTGIEAGQPDEKGKFPKDSVNERVNTRLEQMAHLRHEFVKSSDESELDDKL